MIGEVRQSADNSTFQYMEWIYDRSKNGALVMQMTAQCAMGLTTPTQPYAERQLYYPPARGYSQPTQPGWLR
jgi:hypothetical protein